MKLHPEWLFAPLLITASLLIVASCAAQTGRVRGGDTGGATETFQNREMIVYTPPGLPPAGKRGLVVVLHGGLGNAQRIASQQSESALNMNAVAGRNGFVVAYLSGTPATRFMGSDKLSWNAGGGCCGQPSVNDVEDVGYIKGAIAYLVGKYGIDPARVYGMGHSNGAIMTQRVECETGIYAAIVALSGPLNVPVESCPAAAGKRILAIHGANDENVPVNGGKGTKGVSGATFSSEAHSQQVFTNSGADYTTNIVPGADHALADIDAALKQSGQGSVQEIAAKFFNHQ